jgi:hypothetical protein
VSKPIEIDDSERLTRVLQNTSEPSQFIIVSYPKDAAGHTDDSKRWLDGYGVFPAGTRLPDSAIWNKAPTPDDVARVHAEASAQ